MRADVLEVPTAFGGTALTLPAASASAVPYALGAVGALIACRRYGFKLSAYAAQLKRDDWQEVSWPSEQGGQQMYAHLMEALGKWEGKVEGQRSKVAGAKR